VDDLELYLHTNNALHKVNKKTILF